MASKEFVRAETVRLESKIEHVESNLDAKIDRLELLIKMLIGLAIFGITLANPGFFITYEGNILRYFFYTTLLKKNKFQKTHKFLGFFV